MQQLTRLEVFFSILLQYSYNKIKNFQFFKYNRIFTIKLIHFMYIIGKKKIKHSYSASKIHKNEKRCGIYLTNVIEL
jgi:hypothetical protein